MATDGLADRPWLLLPGTLCTSAVFDAFLDALAVPSCRRQSVELNRPTVEDYAEILADLSEDTVVCGFSLGAIVAAHNADRMKAHRLVLFGFNPFCDPPDRESGRHILARDVAELGGGAALTLRTPDLHGPAPDVARQLIYDMADATSDWIDAQTALALGRPNALAALSHTRIPVRVLTGSQDAISPPAQGRAAAQAAPDGQFCLLDGLGHYALIEDPIACADALMKMEETVHDTA